MTTIPTSPASSAPAYPAPRRAGCPMDPAPLIGSLQAEAPLARVTLWNGTRAWLVTRHAEARRILRDPRFSADLRAEGFPFVSPSQLIGLERPISFIRMDAPEHTRRRRMLTSEFMIKRVAQLRPEIDEVVEQLLDDVAAAGPPVDLVKTFTLPLPSLVICRLLGVPYQDHEFFQRCSAVLLNQASDADAARDASDRLRGYLHELVERKAAHPEDDLLSRMISEHEANGDLNRDDIVANALLLLVAGHETTANMTAMSIIDLQQHPEQWAALRERPELIPGAVEELLRHLSILHTGVPRAALEDVEVGDTTIRAGEGVLISLQAANHDARAFDDPGRLDVARSSRSHVAFGFGVHQCLGQPLARAELQSALTAVLRRFPNLKLAKPVEEIPFRETMTIYGVYELPVTW
jgi:cytochrome P450